MKKKIITSIALFMSFFTIIIIHFTIDINQKEINTINIIDNENSEVEDTYIVENDKSEEIIDEENIEIQDEEDTLDLSSVMVQALVSLNIREQPTTSSTILGQLTKYESVNYLDSFNDSWYEIYYQNNIAYVSSNLEYSRIFDSESNDTIEQVITAGIFALETPYEYGSARILNYNGSLNSNYTGDTYDCSAFIQYIFYTGANIKLYGDSRSMSVQGNDIDFADIQRGDVIFMTSTSRLNNVGIEKIGHVGIYLGNNLILHTFGTGGVRIQFYSDFWKGRFIKAKRMI